MGFAPVLDALHVLGIAEVITVLRLVEPGLLSSPLAGPFALGSRAILLAFPVAVVRDKQLITVQAFTTTRFRLHQIEAASLKTPTSRRQAGRKRAAQEDEKKKRRRGFVVEG
jgi:hypothetical protein